MERIAIAGSNEPARYREHDAAGLASIAERLGALAW